MPQPGRPAGLAAVLVLQSMPLLRASPDLRVGPDGSFKIAMFCDMHYGEDPAKDLRSSRFQRRIVESERPNLVVVDGDASSNYAAPACGAANASACQEWYDKRWQEWTRPLEESGTPYAYTLGNHDRIPGLNGGSTPGIETDYAVPDHWITRKDEKNPHSLTRDGPASIHGASNYVLPVLGADGRRVAYVWMLDSSDNACLGKTGWGCVYPDQVQWYRETSKQLIEQDGRAVPGVMFHHIPMDEVNAAWNDPSVEVNGSRGEDVCCFSVNTGLFEAIKEVGNIWGAFHGHDHNNDFVALYRGILIGYGRKSGFGGYGGKVADRAGSRIVELRAQGGGAVAWQTWIREFRGAKVRQPRATNRTAGPAACCGTAAAAGLLREEGPVEAARRLCRSDDDAGACRVAAGIHAGPGLTVFA